MTIAKVKKAISKYNNKLQELNLQLKELRGNIEFDCVCCNEGNHKIKDCSIIQTHWYESPSGCIGGDTWHEGELHILCPNTSYRNRVLFNIPYDERKVQNAETRFRWYLSLFKDIKMEYDKPNYRWANNYFFDKNRDLLDLNGDTK